MFSLNTYIWMLLFLQLLKMQTYFSYVISKSYFIGWWIKLWIQRNRLNKIWKVFFDNKTFIQKFIHISNNWRYSNVRTFKLGILYSSSVRIHDIITLLVLFYAKFLRHVIIELTTSPNNCPFSAELFHIKKLI